MSFGLFNSALSHLSKTALFIAFTKVAAVEIQDGKATVGPPKLEFKIALEPISLPPVAFHEQS